MSKLVYCFSQNQAEGRADMKDILGGKGANLAEMCNIGIRVPPGFTISTELCSHYYKHQQTLPTHIEAEMLAGLRFIEEILGLEFGSSSKPLLVSVRSGSRASMPGMMDTILNLGLNDQTVQALAEATSNERFAYDSYRRFIQMYASVVLGVEHYCFEELLEDKKRDLRVTLDTDLNVSDLKDLVHQYKQKVQQETGAEFPSDVKVQLWGAVKAVLSSWMNPRAEIYRRLHDIPASWGTAVNIQAMVFGNMGETCATGVAFTRDPSTGENEFYGEYLINAQGEDVVAGIRTPAAINIYGKRVNKSELPSMEETMPEVYQELLAVYKILEQHYKDMQDIEFTVQNKKLWILQTRNGKRSAASSIKIAVDMVGEGLISKETALLRIDPLALDQLLHPTLDPKAKCQIIGNGLRASPGAASGMVVFSALEAEEKVMQKNKVILVRIETSPEDISGMHAAEGILTSRGGMTSHAAVVARGLGKPCVSGASALLINYETRTIKAGGIEIKAGDMITINGSTGDIILGTVLMIQPSFSKEFDLVMAWADSFRQLKIRTNAETILDASTARKFGAEGIGLCRTEHMFFDEQRITFVREMIVAKDVAGREIALAKLLPVQRADFVQIFKIMQGFPVNIRLLDPPLHEFLPHSEADIRQVATSAGISFEFAKMRVQQLHETNPMLGHRGCRLGITYPEIYAMQARAIFEAMVEVVKQTGICPIAEIMIPIVMSEKELAELRNLVESVAAEVMASSAVRLEYQIGTMIELPRAALLANRIAEYADYLSFGTNDLTQTTFGISRDDASSFLNSYQSKGILEYDPFVKLDEDGVGELIKIAVERGRSRKPNLKIGVCGEHGGEPAAIVFFQKMGLDYVSCSPYRVPIARLAAAQAVLKLSSS